jgi:thymidylate kinase
MQNQRGPIVLLGFDGSGKSSCLGELKRMGYATSSWTDLRDVAELSYCREASVNPRLYRENLPPFTRAAFVLSGVFAEYEFLVEPAIKKGRPIIVDSYYLRPIAKEIIKGRSVTAVLELASLLPAPRAVIVFDIGAETAFQRKVELSMHEVLKNLTLSDFTCFQRKVLDHALTLVNSSTVFHIDANASHDQVVRQVLKVIERLDGHQ